MNRLISKCFILILATITLLSSLTMFAASGICSGVISPDDGSVTPPEEVRSISAKYVVLYNAASGKILYETRGTDKAFPASTTKIMTAIIVLEKCNMDDEVTLGNIVETSGSVMGVSPGEKFKVSDLLYGMMLVSGNDAARALAEHVSGTRAEFAVVMNEYAEKIGMEKTHFANPNGLDSEEHYSTAYDMALLTAYAMKNSDFRKIVATETYTISKTNKHEAGFFKLENSNRLIHTKSDDTESYKYEYAIGVKTGDTEWAGRCLIAAANKDGMELIAVVLGDYEDSRIGTPRYGNAKKLFNFGFEYFQMVKAEELKLSDTVNYDISGSNLEQTTLKIDYSDAYLCVPKSQLSKVKAEASTYGMKFSFNSGEKLTAPISEGDKVGTVNFVANGETLFTANLIATTSVAVSDSSSTGEKVEEVPEKTGIDYQWLFWLLCACVLIVIAILIVAILKRKPKQMRYNRRRRSGMHVRGRSRLR